MKVTRLVSILLCCTLMCTLIIGCSNGTSEEGNQETVNNITSESKSNETDSNVIEEPVEISLFWKIQKDPIEEGHPIVEEIQAQTGVKVNYLNIPWNAYTDKLNLSVNTGDMADIIMTAGKSYELASTWVEQGVFLPLDDYLVDAPNIMEKVPEDMWDAMKMDGQTYWIPRTNVASMHVFHIREDWLQKYNLEAPTTLDELYEVGLAFSNDPDGNGIDDTYALGSFGASGLFWLRFLSTAYDLPLDKFKSIDGEIQFCSAVPEAKEWITYANKLFEEGILDPEFAILQASEARDKMYQGKLGMIGMPITDNLTANSKFAEAGLDGKFQMYAPPKGDNGQGGFTTMSGVPGTTGYWMTGGISSMCETPEAAMKVMDFLYSDEGSTLTMWGREGIEYEIVDGNFSPLISKEEFDALNLRCQDLAFVHGDPLKEIGTAGDMEYLNRLVEISEGSLYDDFILITPNTQRIGELNAQLGEFAHEQLVKFIVGDRPLDEFEDYCQEWLDRGGAELIEEIEKELTK